MTSGSQSLQDTVALVTGGSRGIGRAAALALATAGARVAVNYKTRMADAETVCAEIKSRGGHAVAVQADVSSAAQVAEMVRQVEQQLGPVAILVNKAGISRLQPFDKITEQDWDEVVAVNLKSVFLVTQAVLPRMRAAKWGRIINLSSVAAQTGGVIGPHYAASKAGILPRHPHDRWRRGGGRHELRPDRLRLRALRLGHQHGISDPVSRWRRRRLQRAMKFLTVDGHRR